MDRGAARGAGAAVQLGSLTHVISSAHDDTDTSTARAEAHAAAARPQGAGVSWQAVQFVYEQVRDTTGPEQAVLVALAEHADEDGGSIFPSIERLVERTRFARRTVMYAIAELLKRGRLVKVGRYKRCWKYQIVMKAQAKGARGAHVQQVHTSKSAPPARERGTSRTRSGAPAAPDPPVIPHRSRKDQDPRFAPDVESWADECRRLHGSECTKKRDHAFRMAGESAQASRPQPIRRAVNA